MPLRRPASRTSARAPLPTCGALPACARVQVEEVGKIAMSLKPIFDPANFEANMAAMKKGPASVAA